MLNRKNRRNCRERKFLSFPWSVSHLGDLAVWHNKSLKCCNLCESDFLWLPQHISPWSADQLPWAGTVLGTAVQQWAIVSVSPHETFFLVAKKTTHVWIHNMMSGNQAGSGGRGCWWGDPMSERHAIWNNVVREVNRVRECAIKMVEERTFLAGEQQFQGPEAGMCLVGFRKNKEAGKAEWNGDGWWEGGRGETSGVLEAP